MNLNNSELIISAGNVSQVPKNPIPHIVMLGRSNVGKSSLINKVLNRKSLARTSGSPGKTQTINFYEIDKTMYLVDLPGYGYAKRAITDRERWGKLIEGYLASDVDMRLMVQLIDIRHNPTKDDVIMVNWLKEMQTPFIIVATKCDKISKKQASENVQKIRECLALDESVEIIPFSAEKGDGREDFLKKINSIL